jgi:transcriptional regulator with XRE-family HTH domain
MRGCQRKGRLRILNAMKSDLGARLRDARQAKGVSLRSVASALGVSASLLSQVETGKVQPSVSTLYSLVSYLGLSLDDLLGTTPANGAVTAASSAHPAASPVQRQNDNLVLEMDNGVTWERIAAGGFHAVDPLLTTYPPGASSSKHGEQMTHSGIEYGYILEGELTLRLDSETFRLGPGDSLCFDSTRPHLYLNESESTVRGLWFVLGRSPADESLASPHHD